MSVLNVGAGQQYSSIQAAIDAAKAGDTIDVQAGTYNDQYFDVTKPLTIQAVNGMVVLTNDQDIPNGKAEAVIDASATIRGFEFTGAKVDPSDANGAGIRYEAGNLVVDHCYFYNNQEGILGGAVPGGTVVVENSEFSHNGTGDGYTHALYIGDIASLTVTNSYFHDTSVGHDIKSRAESTTIVGNVIADGTTGTASYEIDVPDGGATVIQGNVIEKGPNASNSALIHYGGETSTPYANSSLLVDGNTILNDYSASTPVGVLNATSVTAEITNNQIWGLTPSEVASGPNAQSGNSFLQSEPTINVTSPWLPGSTASVIAGLSSSSVSNLPPPDLSAPQGAEIALTPGDAHVIAGQGSGTAVLQGYLGWYSVDVANGVATIVDNHGNYGTLYLTGIDKLQTWDGVYDIRTPGTSPAMIGSQPGVNYNGDYLQGQTGASNNFVFSQGGTAQDEIAGFQPATDHIDVVQYAGSTLSAATLVSTATTDSAGDALLHLDPGHTVALLGVSTSQLSVSEFSVQPVGTTTVSDPSGSSGSSGSTGSTGSTGGTTPVPPPTADIVGASGSANEVSITAGVVHSVAGQPGDVAAMEGYLGWYSITSAANGVTTVVDNHSNYGTVTLTGVSQLQLWDGVYNLTPHGPTKVASAPGVDWHGAFLQGQAGVAESFDFAQGGSAHDMVSRFDPTLDHLIVTKSAGSTLTAASLAAGATSDAAGDAVLHLSAHHEVSLVGVTVAQVHAHPDYFLVH